MPETSGDGPRALIVGAGHGCRVHLPALREAGFAVVGLVGTDPGRVARAAERNGVPAAFTDIDQALATTGATVVTVASPPHSHAAVVHAALARACHILCEKPFARDAAEARAMLAAAAAAGVVHLIGNQMRTLPARIAIARAIADGRIGSPRFASFVQWVAFVADPAVTRQPWWFDAGAGGGWLGASGSHMIDMIRSWLGDFANVSAATPVVSQRENVADDSFVVRFRTAGGVDGVLQQTGGAWGPMTDTIRVGGSHGTVWIEKGEAWIADKDGARKIEVPPELALPAMAPSGGPTTPYLHIELPPTIRLMQRFRAAIEGRPDDGPPLATFADGVKAMAAIDAIRASAMNGGETVAVGGG